MMEFWSIERLKNSIREGTLSESAKFGYLFIVVILLGNFNNFFGQPESDLTGNILLTALWILSGTGLYIQYRWNGGNNGRFFSEKFLSISFVETIRFMPAFIFLILVMPTMHDVLFKSELPEYTTVLEAILFSALYILLMWRTAVHIRDVK